MVHHGTNARNEVKQIRIDFPFVIFHNFSFLIFHCKPKRSELLTLLVSAYTFLVAGELSGPDFNDK